MRRRSLAAAEKGLAARSGAWPTRLALHVLLYDFEYYYEESLGYLDYYLDDIMYYYADVMDYYLPYYYYDSWAYLDDIYYYL